MGTVITLSGAIGTRRSKLAEALSERLQWPKVKFSDRIKQLIVEQQGDPEDRTLLQEMGQRMVEKRLTEFVGSTLDMAPDWRQAGNLIVDGLRHVEVLLELRRQVLPSRLIYVLVEASPTDREIGALERGIPEQNLYRYERDLTEAQISRILPPYANLKLDSRLGIGFNVDEIVAALPEVPGGGA